MAYSPDPAGPRNIRELYHWVWKQLLRVAELNNDPGQTPGHSHVHADTLQRDAANSHPMSAITGLVSDQGRQDTNLTDHEGAYNPHAKMNWIFPYVEGGPWIKDDVSRDGIFTGVANKDTTEPLGPVPTGVPFWPTDGVPLYTNLFQLLGVKVGNVYTMAQEGVINSARINIPIENVGLLVTASIHVNDVQLVETTYVPRVDGIHIYNIAPAFVFIGDVIRIEVDTIKQTGNTQVHYLEAAAYWGTYSDPMFSSAQGLYDEVPNTNGYDIDMEFQPADVSADWDILAVSNASLQADNNPINTRMAALEARVTQLETP